jgi:hypothetical protein
MSSFHPGLDARALESFRGPFGQNNSAVFQQPAQQQGFVELFMNCDESRFIFVSIFLRAMFL